MPPVALAAGITAAGAIGGTALQARAAGRASKAQDKATAEALAYEREKEAARKLRYDQAMAQRQKAFDAWYGRVGDEGLKRYGVPNGLTLPSATPTKAVGLDGRVATGSPVAGAAAPPQAVDRSRMTLASLMRPQQPAAAPAIAPAAAPALVPQTPRTLADLMQGGGWEDWRRYGTRL